MHTYFWIILVKHLEEYCLFYSVLCLVFSILEKTGKKKPKHFKSEKQEERIGGVKRSDCHASGSRFGREPSVPALLGLAGASP